MPDLHLSELELRDALINNQIIKAVKTAFPDTNFGAVFAPPPLGATYEEFDDIRLALDAEPITMWLGMACLYQQVENAFDVTVLDDTMDNIRTIGDFRKLVVATTTGKTTEQLQQAVEKHKLRRFRQLLAQAREERETRTA